MVEAVPGGPLDRRLPPDASGEEVLAGLLDVLYREAPWEYERLAGQVTAWSGVLLTAPPHLEELYRLAARHQETADRFANCFSDPGDLIGWFLHPERALAYVDGVRRAEPARSSHLPTS